jgi:Asp-tRNA(Asn)/Glu-tRNA(Gln) amidotransferase A subunit family amidase
VLPLAPSFDTVGALARDLATLGQVLDVMSGVRAGEPVRRVFIASAGLAEVAEATSGAVRSVAAALAESTGCELAEWDIGAFCNSRAADLFSRIQARQVWTTHGRWLAANMDVLAPDVAARARRGQELSVMAADDWLEDESDWHAYTEALGQALPDDAVAVLPVMQDLPPLRTASAAELQEFRVSAFRFTTPASLSGRPELVIPVRVVASGKWIGVGILGPDGGDAELLRLAAGICPQQGTLAM